MTIESVADKHLDQDAEADSGLDLIAKLRTELAIYMGEDREANWWYINRGFPLLSHAKIISMLYRMIAENKAALVEAERGEYLGVSVGLDLVELS